MAARMIDSDTLVNTEEHFFVKAGPGAGKTYWLIQHIKHVLATSLRLGKAKKIACITYTNIGVETIQNRLSNCSGRVDITTIHSFLYDNIIKPYFHFIAKEEGFAIEKLKVVDDTLLTSNRVFYKLKDEINLHYLKDDQALKKALHAAHWYFYKGKLQFGPSYPHKCSRYPIPLEFYAQYKKYAWKLGVMHYDDVLYFAYKLMVAFPFITQVLSAKYPYIFIDEFQDSTPVQIEIMKLVASSPYTVLGVIGDKAQAIYGFAGTDYALFEKFELPRMQNYEILGNRRCSVEIIDLLNSIRKDLTQQSVNGHHSVKPILYVGDSISSYNEFRTSCNAEIVTLSYAKVTSNALRKQLYKEPYDEDLINLNPDTDWERALVLLHSVKAIEFSLIGAINDAMKSLKKIVDDERNQLQLISKLLYDYEIYKDQSIDFFLNYLRNDLGVKVTGLRSGIAKTFYSSIKYSEFALFISSPDLKNLRDKTIHHAKGDEFENVLLVLNEEKDIKFLTTPNLDESKDEQRVYYVALSRAKNRLAISVPSLSKANEIALSKLPIEIKRI